MNRPAAVVQARVGSTRLPGKVLRRVAGDTLLGHLLRRLARSREVDRTVVATTRLGGDDAVVEEAGRHGIVAYRGEEDDVLKRYLGAARAHGVDPVVRVTADCPLLDPEVLDEAVRRFQRVAAGNPEAALLVTNGGPTERTYPRGLDVEVVSLAALEAADAALPPGAPEREHVTAWLYRHAEAVRIERLRLPLDLSFLRWTVDTAEDFAFVTAIYDELGDRVPDFGFRDVLSILGRRPELVAINVHVRQKAT